MSTDKKKKIRKIILLTILFLAIIGVSVGYYLWNMPHIDVQAQKADVTIDVTSIVNEYLQDEKKANDKYLSSFNYDNAIQFSDNIDLLYIEPFTLLTLDYSSGKLTEFYEFRWDGENKHLKKLDQDTNQIWSSATLYSPTIQQARQQLFRDWVVKHQDFEDKMILNFHNRKHGLNISDDLLMKGEGDLMTLSISQIHFGNNTSHFNYSDIINKRDYKVELLKNELVNA